MARVRRIISDLHRQAVAAFEAGRWDDAKVFCSSLIASAPDSAVAHHLAGLVERRLGNLECSLSLFRKAIFLNPLDPAIRNNYGLALIAAGMQQEAFEQFNHSLDLKPDQVEVLLNSAHLLRTLGRTSQSVTFYQRAIHLRPDFARSYLGLGNAMYDLRLFKDALLAYNKALSFDPSLLEALTNSASALFETGRTSDAISLLTQSLAADKDNPLTLTTLARVLRDTGRDAEARECYKRALSITPNSHELRWLAVTSQLRQVYSTCIEMKDSMRHFEHKLDDFIAWHAAQPGIDISSLVGLDQPYYLAYNESCNRDILFKYGRLIASISSSSPLSSTSTLHSAPHSKIRLGFVSAQIFNHSVWHAITKGWLVKLPRDTFDLIVYSLGTHFDSETVIAQSLATSFHQGPRSLNDWISCILGDLPDILIFPEIGMDPLTLQLASKRLARVQIASWGHPETTGFPFIDYFVSAESLESPNGDQNYTEKLLKLPGIGTYVEPFGIEPAKLDLSEICLEGRKLLLCPGTPYKYLPNHDQLFPRIVQGIDDALLVFFIHRKQDLSFILRDRLRLEFCRQGVDFNRSVIFIPWQNTEGFFGLLSVATAMLDTIGFSGFNTALQALECDCPIVAYEGDYLRGRLTSGIMRHLSLDECTVSSESAYVSLARRFLTDSIFRDKQSDLISARKRYLFHNDKCIKAFAFHLSDFGSKMKY